MTEQESNLIQSLSRGLSALELIAESSTTPRLLADFLGVDRSTAYRILMTLSAHGFVERDPLSEQYIISSRKIFTLSSTISANSHWPTLATPWLARLRDKTNEAVSLAVLQGREVVYVSHLPGNETITIGPLLGVRRPIHCSAVGKAIAAFLPPDELDLLIHRTPLAALTIKTITNPLQLRRELERVCQDGYAVDDEETFPDVRCVAAPVRDHSRRVVASIGLSGPASRVTPERFKELGELVRTLAGDFSASLGAV